MYRGRSVTAFTGPTEWRSVFAQGESANRRKRPTCGFHPLRPQPALASQYCGGRFLNGSGDEDRVASNDTNFGLAIFVGAQPGYVLRNHHVIAAPRFQQNEFHEMCLLTLTSRGTTFAFD